MKSFDFDSIETIEIPVKYKGVDYVLREASAGAVAKFTNARTNRTTYGANGAIEAVRDGGDLKPLLVSMCLFTTDGKPVTEAFIKEWPDRLIDPLFDQAKLISGIDQPTDIEGLERHIAILQERLEELKKSDLVKNS